VRIDVLTLFPGVMEPFFASSIIARARAAGIVSIWCTNPRDFTTDRHRSVDDRPFGGGPGMVMMCGPLFDAVEKLEKDDPTPAVRILLTPQGERFDQAIARELAREKRLILICGHYEGFDADPDRAEAEGDFDRRLRIVGRGSCGDGGGGHGGPASAGRLGRRGVGGT